MKLIYVMDPLCGWCYGNASNTQKLFIEFGTEIDFEIFPAGMWTGSRVKKQEVHLADYFIKNDTQIAKRTGTPFGTAYFEFIQEKSILLDSEIPSRAIVTVKDIAPAKAIPFAVEVQRARYFHGRDLNSDQTYTSICEGLHIDSNEFLKVFSSDQMKQKTQETFVLASQFASSYPTLLIEKEGKYYTVEQGYATYSAIVERINQLKN